MRPILISLSLLTVTLLLGCSDKTSGTPSSEANKVTQTRMNDIDRLEGTISDEMIITDDANDEALLDTETTAKTDAKTLASKPEAKPAASASAKTSETNNEAASEAAE